MKRVAVIVLPAALIAVTAVALLLGEALLWRSQVLALKARGELEFITWNETFRWMLPSSPVYLSNLLEGRNPNVALTNTRYVSPADAEQGESLFRQYCSGCHGGGGEGVSGPPLNQPSRYRSDWSLYRTIQRGIPGTSMPAHDLRDPAIWQIITYLATLAPDPADVMPAVVLDIDPVSYSRITARPAEMDNWLSYSGGYDGSRFSDLAEINAGNANTLTLRWAYQSATSYKKLVASPVVADGYMFITEPDGRVVALDAQNGELLWSFERPIPGREDLALCCGISNRGVAVLDDTVFVTTIDAGLLALDIRTGLLKWEVDVADHRVGYSITAAPLAIEGKIITGVAGGEMAIRGFLAAFDADTGEEVWRFNTVPAPGEPGSATWGDSDRWQIGGASTWMTGSYDPDLDLLYWGTSHSIHEPESSGAFDKYFGSSILAIRGATGELVWHFQATPDDIHGFDAAQVPVLADLIIEGQQRKLLLNANRNGFFYSLDRATGEFLGATEFARQSWSLGLDASGRPRPNPEARPSADGTRVWPNSVGATNWWPPAYHPDAELMCLPVVDGSSVYYTQDARHVPGEPYVAVVGQQSFNEAAQRFIRCLRPADGSLVWQKELQSIGGRLLNINMSGLLLTRGDLLFAADNTEFMALDISVGKDLWRINTGGSILGPPITYRAGDSQFIAVTSGRSLLVFGLPDTP